MKARRSIVMGVAIALLVGLQVPASAEPTVPQADWEMVGELDSPVAHGAVVSLTGGRALLTGVLGRDLSRVLLYEPSTGFRRVADAPAPLRWHFAAGLADGRVLVGGGGDFFDRSKLTDRCFIYDPATDTWSEAAPLPLPTFWLYSNPALTLLDGRMIVTGGSTPNEAYRDPTAPFGFDVYLASRNVFLFDPSGETVLPDGRVLVGSWSSGEPMPTTHVFATHVPSFDARTSIPIESPQTAGRVAHQSILLPDGRVLLVGGREYNPGVFYGVPYIDAYDPATNTWTRLAEMPSVAGDGDQGYGGRGFPGVSLLGSGDVLIFGGLPTQLAEERKAGGDVKFKVKLALAPPRPSSLVFNPVTRQFIRVGDLNVRRHLPLGVPWLGGALAIGGSNIPNRPVPESEVFDPVSMTWSLLPPEPAPTSPDFSPRMGVLLSDGTVLTWSSLHFSEEPIPPFNGPGGLRTAKRLHPAGL